MSITSTPTLLRVKRRKNDDPLDVLVLEAKKRKTDPTSEVDDVANIKILKLATTIDADDSKSGQKLTETVSKILAKRNYPNFEELKQRYKKSLNTTAANHAAATKEAKSKVGDARQDHRFRLVAQRRALKLDELEDWPEPEEEAAQTKDAETETSPDKELFHLFDVVSDCDKSSKEEESKKSEKISCNGVEMIREYVDAQKSEEDYGYVYDVYYTDGIDGKSADFDDSLLDSLVSIHPFNSGHGLFDEYRDDPDEFKYEDDEDSNDEFNDKNDYPDDEEDDDDRYYCGYDDDGENDLGCGMRGLGLASSESDGLSSDEEDQLLYTRSFDEDVAARSGAAYAKFKQRMLKEFYEDEDEEEEALDDD